MTVLEYFDYEKQLLRDYEAVKTPHAKAAVFKTLTDTLDTHKEFVFNTISSFEENIKNVRADLQKVQKGETPSYVKDMMAEFGFYEAEEVGLVGGAKDYAEDSLLDACKADAERADGEKKAEKKRRSRGRRGKKEKAEKEEAGKGKEPQA